MSADPRALPEGFLLGCATSAYQIEGGIENDWSAWERAGRLHDDAARCGRAVDHWSRWREDFGLLSELGADAYRFSVEWARVEPEPGRWDEDALATYRAMVDELLARGIQPFVTLLHFTHPPWFHARCPWDAEGGEAVARFVAFSERVAEALGPGVVHWTVLNEPMIWLAGAYLGAALPPGRSELGAFARAFTSLVRAHAGAAAALRARHPEARIGVANHVARVEASRPGHPLDRLVAPYVERHLDHAFVDACRSGRARLGVLPGSRVDVAVPEAAGSLDFIGVNFYTRIFVEATPLAVPRGRAFHEDRGGGHGVSDLGWEILPDRLGWALDQMAGYGLPLYVTENGIDDRDDSRRAAFLYDHLAVALEARARGVDLRGYLHWSLLDNFEWLHAFGPRFGLYAVDRETMARRPTRGAELFAEIARARRLPELRPEVRPRAGTGRVPVG